MADHDPGPIVDLSQTCKVCGKKFTAFYFLRPKEQWDPCPGPGKVVTGKNVRLTINGKVVKTFSDVEYTGEWHHSDYVVGKAESCECGAATTGVQKYKPGHSSWCPVREV